VHYSHSLLYAPLCTKRTPDDGRIWPKHVVLYSSSNKHR